MPKNFFIFLFILFLSFASAEKWEFNSRDDFFNNPTYPVSHSGIDTNEDFLSVISEIYPYLWVANSGDSTISKVDTTTNTEVARYRTGPAGSGHLPSRTTVDKEGNIWVGNREGNRNVVKIAGNIADCIDRNGDGEIDTSTGPKDVLGWEEDECVLLSVRHWVNKGVGPRAIATDLEGYIWVGIWKENRYYKLDSNNGDVVFTIADMDPYGAVIDKDGILWSAKRSHPGAISKINTTNNKHLGYTNFTDSAPDFSVPYGIIANKDNKIYFTNAPIEIANPLPGGGFGYVDGNNLITINQTIFDSAETEDLWYRGITSDNEGHIWFSAHRLWGGKYGVGPGLLAGSIYRINSSTNEVICKQTNFGNYREPIGVVMDSNYKIWAIFRKNLNINLPGAAFKLNSNCDIEGTVVLGKEPYTYSDATGAMLQQFIKDGWWKVTIFSQSGGLVNWSNMSWTGLNPGGGAFINISLNFSENKGYVSYYYENDFDLQTFTYDLTNYVSTNLTIYIKIGRGNSDLSHILNRLVIMSYKDESSVEPSFPPVSDIGSCSWIIDPNAPECAEEDEIILIDWTGVWTWEAWNDFASKGNCTNYILATHNVIVTGGDCIKEGGSWHYDPDGKHEGCEDLVQTVDCSSILRVPFFTKNEFIIVFLIILLIHLLIKRKS